jgi:PhnB protein
MAKSDENCPHGGTVRAIPVFTVKGADKALEHYKKAFGATETYPPMKGPDGAIMHASFHIGETEFFVTEENVERGCVAGQNQSFYIYVPDADEGMQKALGAGLTEFKKTEDMFWGDRMGMVTDPYGIKWSIATHMRDVSPQEMESAAKNMGAA